MTYNTTQPTVSMLGTYFQNRSVYLRLLEYNDLAALYNNKCEVLPQNQLGIISKLIEAKKDEII
jgi:hypothetical protein